MATNICLNCPDRHVGCHGQCPKWAEYVKERDEVYRKRAMRAQINRVEKEEIQRRNRAASLRYKVRADRDAEARRVLEEMDGETRG